MPKSRVVANLPPRDVQVLCKLKGGGYVVAKRDSGKTVHFMWYVPNGRRRLNPGEVIGWRHIAADEPFTPFDTTVFETP